MNKSHAPTSMKTSPARSDTYPALVASISDLLQTARGSIAQQANSTLLQTYWSIGAFIVEYEQNGADRATYGADIIHRLSADLRARFGRGFSKTNLIYMRKFYLAFRKKSDTSDLFGLTWSHCMEILKCDDSLEVSFYCKECSQSKWSVRELKRQMKSMLFHRIALSKDKQGVLELARKGASVQRPEDILG